MIGTSSGKYTALPRPARRAASFAAASIRVRVRVRGFGRGVARRGVGRCAGVARCPRARVGFGSRVARRRSVASGAADRLDARRAVLPFA